MQFQNYFPIWQKDENNRLAFWRLNISFFIIIIIVKITSILPWRTILFELMERGDKVFLQVFNAIIYIIIIIIILRGLIEITRRMDKRTFLGRRCPIFGPWRSCCRWWAFWSETQRRWWLWNRRWIGSWRSERGAASSPPQSLRSAPPWTRSRSSGCIRRTGSTSSPRKK